MAFSQNAVGHKQLMKNGSSLLVTLWLRCVVAMRVTLAVYELDIESIIVMKCYLFVLVCFSYLFSTY